MKFMLQHRLATPVIQPRMHFFDKEGKPLIGGKVYSFKVGEDIFKPTYRNSEFTAANQNPILLDQAGSALIYVRGSVQLKIYDKSGVFIEEKIVYQQQMRTQFFDKYGKALGSGKVWTYDYQSTIKKPSYENADDALLNPNPVILDENGWGSVSIVGAYRLRQYDKKGVFVGDQDFKRPPARVLTSRVYPAYTDEDIFTSSNVVGGALHDSTMYEQLSAEFMLSNALLEQKFFLAQINTDEKVAVDFNLAYGHLAVAFILKTLNTDVESFGADVSIIAAELLDGITIEVEHENIFADLSITNGGLSNV